MKSFFRHQTIWLTLVFLVCGLACRRKAKPESSVPEASAQSASGADAPAIVTAKLADPGVASAPLPPPDAELTVMVERRFLPAQQMNAYSPAQAGDYQAQLNLYNRVLRKRVQSLGNTPETFQELMASSGYPKPPQPPAGRTLVYDKKTVTVSLQ